MWKINNNVNSDFVYNAIVKDNAKYSLPPDAFCSVTDLIKPHELVVLNQRCNANEFDIEVEASKFVSRWLGSIMDKDIRIANNLETMRLDFPFGKDKDKLSGEFDAFVKNELIDFKLAKVWWYKHGLVDDLIKQLNCYYALLLLNGVCNSDVKLQGHVVIRDHSKIQSIKQDYPRECQIVNVDRWPLENTITFINERIQSIKLMKSKSTEELIDMAKANKSTSEAGFAVIGESKTIKIFWCRNFNSCDEAEAKAFEHADNLQHSRKKSYKVERRVVDVKNILYSDFEYLLI